MNPDGSGIQPITDGTADSDAPKWSPNGKLIAYEAPDPANTNLVRVWVAGADGSQPHEVAPLAGFNDLSPSWSPDGTRLIFVRQNPSAMPITETFVVANADGSGTATAIPGTDNNDFEPAWSPDGGRIAFVHNTGGSNAVNAIYTMSIDGTGRTPLDTPPSTRMDDVPVWSADGTTVWFSRGLPAVGCSSQSQIYAVPSNASGPAVLISKDPTFSDYSPAPSPDGTRVAFIRCDDSTDNTHHIYTMNVDGTGVNPVTSGSTVDDYTPDWQPTAPQFMSLPSISGNDVNNQTLTATAGSSPGGGAATLQFERCDSQGATCVSIPGATTTTYRLTSADLGHTIRVHQTQTNALGSAAADSAQTSIVVPSKAHCSNRFMGTAKANRIKGSRGSDRINGGRGRDRLSGLAGADCISGGAGNDTILGGTGNDTLNGGAGNDRISAGPGRNSVSGGSGNDTINVRNHRRDVVNCGKGMDRVLADGIDKLRGCEHVTRRK